MRKLILVLAVTTSIISCGKNTGSSRKENPKFNVQVVVSESFRLGENTYPSNNCIPILLRAVDSHEPGQTLSLQESVDVHIEQLESEPKDLNAAFYHDEHCKNVAGTVTLPSGESSKVRIYMKSLESGEARFKLSYGGANWRVAAYVRYIYSDTN